MHVMCVCMEAHEVHNLVQYRVSEDWRRRGEKKENAFKFMLKCMFYKRTERDLQQREIANWSRIERRAAPYASSFSIDKWLKTPEDGMRWWLELLVNKFWRNSLANYKIHHEHIRARWTHKRMQIIYFIWEQRGGEKKRITMKIIIIISSWACVGGRLEIQSHGILCTFLWLRYSLIWFS